VRRRSWSCRALLVLSSAPAVHRHSRVVQHRSLHRPLATVY
jgi:hypothetical protein